MLLSFAAFVALLPLPVVLGGQIPVVNGIIGGVLSDDSLKEVIDIPQDLVNKTPTTPGKLRVVENSGICGE